VSVYMNLQVCDIVTGTGTEAAPVAIQGAPPRAARLHHGGHAPPCLGPRSPLGGQGHHPASHRVRAHAVLHGPLARLFATTERADELWLHPGRGTAFDIVAMALY
jgi:hypothetical protein